MIFQRSSKTCKDLQKIFEPDNTFEDLQRIFQGSLRILYGSCKDPLKGDLQDFKIILQDPQVFFEDLLRIIQGSL